MRYNAKGEGCVYCPKTRTVEAARTRDLWLTEDDLVERITRARFQSGLLRQAIRDMQRLLAGKSFKPWR